MSDESKKVLPLNQDPMGLFSQPQEGIEAMKGSTQRRKDAAKEAAQKRHSEIINDPYNQNEFIEEFLKHDTWLIFGEAIPISLGIHPLDTNDIGITDFAMFTKTKEIAKSSAGESLKVININNQPSLWRIKPADFVNWMVTKELAPLQSLIDAFAPGTSNSKLNNVKKDKAHSNTNKHSSQREKVLFAALAVLAKYPEKCKTNGEVSVSAIADMMEQKSPIWFEDDLPMARSGIENLIRASIASLAE